MPTDRSVARRWIELGIVIGVIGIGLTLVVPAVQRAREAARRKKSTYNLKFIGLALHTYHDNYSCFPPGGVFNAEGKGFIGWQVSIMPFMDASPLYSRIDFHVPWDEGNNPDVFRDARYPYYTNPLETSPSTDSRGFVLSHYAGNKYLLFPNSSVKLDDLTDGKEQTILAGEIFADYLPYAQPGNWRHPRVGIHQSPQSFGCPNSDGALMLMADGRVHWIPKAINLGSSTPWAHRPAVRTFRTRCLPIRGDRLPGGQKIQRMIPPRCQSRIDDGMSPFARATGPGPKDRPSPGSSTTGCESPPAAGNSSVRCPNAVGIPNRVEDVALAARQSAQICPLPDRA